jgi:transcription-repair coupling factor (superfamily II helicase)
MIFKLPKENGVHYFSGLNQIAEGLLFLDIFQKNNRIIYFTNDAKSTKKTIDFVDKNQKLDIYYLDETTLNDPLDLTYHNIQSKNTTKFKSIIIIDEKNFNKEINLDLKDSNLEINLKNKNVGLDELVIKLNEFGYKKKEFIESSGQFSVRGSVVDIYLSEIKNPIRIQFFKEKVKSINSFDISTMKSLDREYKSISLSSIEKKNTIRKKINELIPDNSHVFFNSDLKWNDSNAEIKEISKKSYIYFSNSIIKRGANLTNLKIIYPTIDETLSPIRKALLILKNHKSINKICFLVNKEEDIEVIKKEYDLPITQIEFFISSNTRSFLIDKENVLFISHNSINKQPTDKFQELNKSVYKLKNFSDLSMNDYIVHKTFGICLYKGLIEKSIDDITIEFVKCEFSQKDLLLIPSFKIELLQKYIGSRSEIEIDCLRNKTWSTKVKKAKKVAERVAKEILSLYAKRKVVRGSSFEFNNNEIAQFESGFEFEETIDQMKAINEVYADMKKPNPMDRLICGDVGFGKTEIALRASFLAAMNAKQVVIIAPTTILVNQHLSTFLERFRKFPLRIESLSRNTTKKAFDQMVKDLADSKIDILIGTHRVLNEKINFKNLGLIIVDEEHKFGVKHKEKIKHIRMGVDYLALSATPIPRTLQLSLSGIKDISTISTPPVDRFSIETIISKFNKNIVKKAIDFELKRDGRVFFIHNEIKTINKMHELLIEIFPNTKMSVVHGQMKPEKIEKNLSNFINGEISILITTTIIESGIDIKEANTIIINNANKFGLSDLYQIRGRVGRGNVKGYAYLLIPENKDMSINAGKRLTAIKRLSKLGTGFNLALEDLEIRGAGNLFGTEQSGNIYEVGVEFYLQLLEDEIRKINKTLPDEVLNMEINSKDKINIPTSYISSAEKRMHYYKRLSGIETKNEILELIEELLDLFGQVPDEILTLIKLAELKIKLKEIKLSNLTINRTNMVFKLTELKNIDVYVKNFSGKIKDANAFFNKITNLTMFLKNNGNLSNNRFIIDFNKCV